MTIRSVGKGERVQRAMSADTWNAFVRAANANDNRDGETISHAGTGKEDSYSTIKVKTNAAVDRREIVGIDAPAILPSEGQQTFDTRMLFSQSSPAVGSFALMGSAAPSGLYETAIAAGIVQCKLFVPTAGAWLDRADIDASGSQLLAKPNGSAQILWKDVGTNTTVDAIVRLGNPQFVALPGKAVETIGAGSSTGVMEVWLNTTTNTGYTIGTSGTQTLDEAIYLDWMHDDQDISDGKEIIIGWFPTEGLWRVIHAECEDNPPELGQLTDGGTAGSQSLTTSPARINAFDQLSPGAISTPNVTIDATLAQIVLPDIAASSLYEININGQFISGTNNAEYNVEMYLNGSPIPADPMVLTINARQANQSTPFSTTFQYPISPQSAPQLSLWIYTSSGTDTIGWQQCIFSIEKNLDF